MLVGDGLLRVFWPNDLPRSSSPGVIVGWRNSDHDLFVITVLEHVEVRIYIYMLNVEDEMD
jgi:phosphatidylinositol glycan class Q protein